jgi:uncharacterized membrane protein YhaH (DUF805 family)
MQLNGPLSKGLASALGALTGVVGLIAMIRLIAGAGFTSMFAWVFLLAAMLPWLGYCVWRARHGRLSARAGLVVLVLDVVGLIGVWLFTLGPVLALAATLLAFVVIWVHDWPQLRERRESQYVRVEELTGLGGGVRDDAEDAAGADEADVAGGYPGRYEAGGARGLAVEPTPGMTTEIPRTAA